MFSKTKYFKRKIPDTPNEKSENEIKGKLKYILKVVFVQFLNNKKKFKKIIVYNYWLIISQG